MKIRYTAALSVLAGTALGAAAIEGLHAQTKKAYTVSELQVVDAKLAADFAPRAAFMPPALEHVAHGFESAMVAGTRARREPSSDDADHRARSISRL